jgi:hypothetical protein
VLTEFTYELIQHTTKIELSDGMPQKFNAS